MNSKSQPTIDYLTAVLVDSMIHLIELISIYFGSKPPYADSFTIDLSQFKAINSQLDMLLCTKPLHPWAITDWHRNFITFLRQTIRQSHHCLKKTITLIDQIPPSRSESLADLWQDLFPLFSQANTWLSAAGYQFSAYDINHFSLGKTEKT